VLSDIFFSYRMFIMIFASVLSFFVVVFFYFLSKPRIKVG